MKRLLSAVALAACVPPPPPVAPTGPQPPGPAAGSDEVPIPPDRPMPATSLNTNASAVLGQPAVAIVDARSDIYSSGAAQPDPERGGVMPVAIQLPRGGHTVTFTRVSGVVGCGTADPPSGADGGGCAGGSTDIQSAAGISGIVDASSTQFLAGVFLAAAPPATAPARLDFSPTALGHDFPGLQPVPGQTFYIGDGHTRAGQAQQFAIPAGATTLYLGIADAYAFHGAPSYYADNTGGFRIEAVVVQ